MSFWNHARVAFVTGLWLLSTAASAATHHCSASYSTRNDWANGFVADIVVKNTGTTPVTGWKVTWSYNVPVALASAPWHATVNLDGNSVVATDNGEHPAVPPGGSVKFGLPLSYTGGAKPVALNLTVNGSACTVAERFYVDPDSNAARWVTSHKTDGRAPDIQTQIANQPTARWFGGWSGAIGASVDQFVDAAAAAQRTPLLVAYNIPGRDCGQYSSGGAGSVSAYQQWIGDFASGVGSRKAVVILEPDALPQLDCLSAAGQADRLQMLKFAVTAFKQRAPNALLYVDAGNSSWLSAAEAASRLRDVGVEHARGFSLNVSNYKTTASSVAYGKAVAAQLQAHGLKKTFVVDTSRNGNGPLGTEWCDPPGRKIGHAPAEHLSGDGPEMTLWVKPPGNADGCAATAGAFDPDLAFKLVHGY